MTNDNSIIVFLDTCVFRSLTNVDRHKFRWYCHDFWRPQNQQRPQELLITNWIFRANVKPDNLFKFHPEHKISAIGIPGIPRLPCTRKKYSEIIKTSRDNDPFVLSVRRGNYALPTISIRHDPPLPNSQNCSKWTPVPPELMVVVLS